MISFLRSDYSWAAAADAIATPVARQGDIGDASLNEFTMVSSDPTDAHGNLFPIFLLGLIQFFLAPITVWRVGSWLYDCVYGGGDKKASETALSAASQTIDESTEWGGGCREAARNKPTLMRKVKSQLSGFNLWLWIFWGISALLVLYIALSQVWRRSSTSIRTRCST